MPFAAERLPSGEAPPLPAWQRTEGKLEARVGSYKGRQVIFVNGKPVAPQMYSGTEHSRETWTGLARRSIQDFTQIGHDIIQTDTWLKYSLRPDGTLDMHGIRRQLAGILEINPRAKILVRINVSAPKWWLAANPGETCKVTAGPEKKEFGGNSMESLASEKYAAFATKHLRQFIRELQETPEGDRVIGFHLGGGVYGEWHYYGIFNEPDASEPMRRRFAAFAAERYGSLKQVNAAWRTSYASFEQIVVPDFERRYQLGDGDYRDPRQDRHVVDYYECQQQTVGALVVGLAKTVKETWPRPTLVGLFYGYFYGGFTVGAQAGQLDVRTVFRSPYVDYFSGPYGSRNMDGSGVSRTLVDSLTLNGKVWMTEHDGGSHLGNISKSKFPDTPTDEAQSIARMRRNFMHSLTEGAGQWWYDFGPKQTGGGWSTPAMLSEARSLHVLANASLEQPYVKPSDVLVVYDMDGFYHVRPARVDALTKKITEALTDSLLGTGAAFDRVFLMDLPKVDLARYKVVIFGNTFALDPSQREFIAKQVIQAGRTVVFMAGCGYADREANSTQRLSEVVGMKVIRAADDEAGPRVTIAGQTAELDDQRLLTRFQVDDAAAQVIGTYASGRPVAATKNINGCRVYYFGVPLKAPLVLFRALLSESQVRLFVDDTVEKDYVAVGGGIIGIYSPRGGAKTIRPLSGAALRVVMPPYSAQYFDLTTGAPLNSLPTRAPASK
ncbi:MAG: hypothetical protein RL515_998 [Verrucomicrobiota bacterium]|jgi:hypothetical protein